MAEGNGADIGALIGMLDGLVVAVGRLAIYQAGMGRDLTRFRNEVRAEFADVVREVAELRENLTELRKEVAFYDGTVVSDGVLISELDELRVTTLGQA